jgi:hypothetical protein
VWSAWRVSRDGAPRRLLWSNSLIALGTLVLGASGTLNSLFGAMTAFAVSLLAGIVVLFCGFLLATAGSPARRTIPPAQSWRPPRPSGTAPVRPAAALSDA